MTFEAVRAFYDAGRFEPLKGDSVSVGNLTGLTVWVHFAVTGPQSDATPWWLLVTPEQVDLITVYQETAEDHYTTLEGGRNRPFSQRGFPSPGHAFRLGPLVGTHHLFLRMTADSAVKIEPSLWQETNLFRYLTGVNTGLGAYFGLVGLLWAMALSRAWMLRNGWDLAYLGYLSGFELFHFVNSGLLEAWGLSQDPSLRDSLLRISIPLTGFSFVALVRTLIVWPTSRSPWTRWLWNGSLALVLLWLIVIWYFRRDLFPEINLLTGVGLLVVGTLSGIWAAVKNYSHARVMILCFLPFVLWVLFQTVIRYHDGITMDIWERQRIMMMTSIAHMFALWLLTFSKDARLQAAKAKLEGEVASLHSEMSNMSLFLSLLTHEMNRPLKRLMNLIRHSDDVTPSIAPWRSQLHAIGTEMNGVMEICVDRIRQASSQTLRRQRTDVRRLLESIINHYRQTSSQRLLTGELTDLPTRFDCDPKLVAILLSNLLENAIRHAPEGSVIHIVATRIDSETIEIRVADEGPGIPEAALESIFDRYVQLNPMTAEQHGGMGLGLFIVRRIAELHNGTVVCKSEVGVGTQFVVRLKSR